MAQVRTSRVIPAMIALYRRLDGLSYPAASSGSGNVTVILGAAQTIPLEYVIVDGAPDPSQIEQRTSDRMNEEFTLRVVVGTQVPQRDTATAPASQVALERLAELLDTVEAGLRDQTTGKPILLNEVTGLDVDVIARQAMTLSVQPQVFADAEGVKAEASLIVRIQAVI